MIDDPAAESLTDDLPNLTRFEWSGLANLHNLADGHARQLPSPAGLDIIAGLSDTYSRCHTRPQLDVQREYEEAFYRLAGQPSVTRRDLRPLHHYSSSISIEVVANYFRATGSRVGLLHPTFDNIPAILRRHGVPLVPVSESVFETPHDAGHYTGIDALFLVTPNNPTGADPTPEVLRAIAQECRARGLVLVVDFSFRFQSRGLAGDDFYDYLLSTGVSHIGIEDSGKTWATHDLKVGSIICDPVLHGPLQAITDDILLNVSPFVFALLSEHLLREGNHDALATAKTNRAVLAAALDGGPVTLVDPQAAMSVAWLRLPPSWVSAELSAWLNDRGISVLPGEPFFWARPKEGEGFIRVALMRGAEQFAGAAAALATALAQYRTDDATAGPVIRQDGAPAPVDDVASLVTELTRELLGTEEFSLESNFFSIGGDSLIAMHLVSLLARRLDVPLRMTALLRRPVLRDFVEEVAALRARAAEDAGDLLVPSAGAGG